MASVVSAPAGEPGLTTTSPVHFRVPQPPCSGLEAVRGLVPASAPLIHRTTSVPPPATSTGSHFDLDTAVNSLTAKPSSSPAPDQLHHSAPSVREAAAEHDLPFTDVPSELFRLRPQFAATTTDNNNNNVNIAGGSSVASYTNPTTYTSNPTRLSPAEPPLPSGPKTPGTADNNRSPSTRTTATSQSASPVPVKQHRKPSPGLAARLKALGFASSHKSSDQPTTNVSRDIGRLTEDQIRQIDLKHQANSVDSIIERRGRPWKGASAPFIFSKPATESAAPQTVASRANASPDESEEPDQSTPRAFLPEIDCPGPIDMDTQKYRLPDHTNGNGTKTHPEVRREHVERDTLPPTPDDDPTPPPPPAKDTPPATTPAEFTPDLSAYFTSKPNRAGSIYTLSRASFANQLAQLTSLQLPDAESLASKVSAIPTAHVASKALINAADQIKSWISKASEVIAGLDSEDDVEWAAAGGREGLAEVENAAARFDELINAYVGAIEGLQSRGDIASVPSDDLNYAVRQMESIISEWAMIQATLGSVKEQVEIAMEWEELWNMVLGDINGELDELCRLVFEMEERRHKSIMAAAGGDNVDIGDLETIVEETPAPPAPSKLAPQNRFALAAFPMSPSSPGTPTLSQDDSSLLALFARMQPLRASLDFLPMRLSVFEARAQKAFPTACDELDMRREGLDATYKKLEKDAESLRKELGEDRWVIVFRGAGRQAQKMIESVERSHMKLKESIDAGHHLTSLPAVSKKMESFEAKKTHYGPAIERVLSIIDKGVKDRLTVNGEILRLHAEMESQWAAIKIQIAEMDLILEDIHSKQTGQQLRDSVSSMLSNDRSTVGSGRDTPGSSPPSSVIMASLGLEPVTPTPKTAKHLAGSHLPHSMNRRHSSLPTPASQAPRRTLGSRTTTAGPSSLPTPGGNIPRPGSGLGQRPRWNSSVNTVDIGVGHNFKPLSATTPSPYAKKSAAMNRSTSSLTPSSGSKLPSGRSPLNRSSSASPMPEETPTRTGVSRLSFRERIGSPGPYAQQPLAKPRLGTSNSMTPLGNRRASLQPPLSRETSRTGQPTRPASSLAAGRRTSMLPQPTMTPSGRESPQAIAGARSAMRRQGSSTTQQVAQGPGKPRWRP